MVRGRERGWGEREYGRERGGGEKGGGGGERERERERERRIVRQTDGKIQRTHYRCRNIYESPCLNHLDGLDLLTFK